MRRQFGMAKLLALGWLLLASLVMMAFIPAIASAVLSPFFAAYDHFYPVVNMRGTVVGTSDTATVLHIKGKKNRDCKYIKITAFDVREAGALDLNIIRIDVQETGGTKPKGVFDIGHWRVWPIDAQSHVRVYVQHDCNGRTVLTMIAEVLP